MSLVGEVIMPLSNEENAALAEHELTISQGLAAFLAVGQALIAIRDGKLYRETHKTFKDYCKKRWKIGQTYAFYLTEAAEIVQELSPSSAQLIQNERQARALAAVPPHLRDEVIKQAKEEDSELTEQAITRIVNKILDKRRAASADARTPSWGDEPEYEDDESGDEEESEAVTPSSTLARAAEAAAKPRLYIKRGLEHLRLAVKDFGKADASEVADEEIQRSVQDGFAAAREVFGKVEEMMANAEETVLS